LDCRGGFGNVRGFDVFLQNIDYRTAAFYNAIAKIAKVVEESGTMFSN
jgi:hypothetical protein